MNIIKYPDERLREISNKVSLPLSAKDRATLDEMYSWLKDNSDAAVGLSAIQIGIAKRMCVIRIKDEKTIGYKLVNPKIIKHSNRQIFMSEGCLSVLEDHEEAIPRWESVVVMAYDAISNKNIVVEATGFLARVFQHEIDHMDGKLYIDYIKEEM